MFYHLSRKEVILFLSMKNKQTLKNYRLLSILPICEKIPERLTFKVMFTLFIEINLSRQTSLVLNQVTLA